MLTSRNLQCYRMTDITNTGAGMERTDPRYYGGLQVLDMDVFNRAKSFLNTRALTEVQKDRISFAVTLMYDTEELLKYVPHVINRLRGESAPACEPVIVKRAKTDFAKRPGHEEFRQRLLSTLDAYQVYCSGGEVAMKPKESKKRKGATKPQEEGSPSDPEGMDEPVRQGSVSSVAGVNKMYKNDKAYWRASFNKGKFRRVKLFSISEFGDAARQMALDERKKFEEEFGNRPQPKIVKIPEDETRSKPPPPPESEAEVEIIEAPTAPETPVASVSVGGGILSMFAGLAGPRD
jgi:hypothetical protein